MENIKVSARLELCRECLELRGPCLDRAGGGERTQRCACEPKEPRWKGYDYNMALELCRGCVAATVPSGSRWSPFFCGECAPRVLAYNRAAGAAIPVGRHSMMNGLGLSGAGASSAAAASALAAGMAGLVDRIDRLWRWRCGRVRRVVQGFAGSEPAIPLERYLERARGASPIARDALDDLARAVAAPPPLR